MTMLGDILGGAKKALGTAIEYGPKALGIAKQVAGNPLTHMAAKYADQYVPGSSKFLGQAKDILGA